MPVAESDVEETEVLKLVTQNTFLHVVDDKTRVKMNRSYSDSDISSSTGSMIPMTYNDDVEDDFATTILSASTEASTKDPGCQLRIKQITHVGANHLHDIGRCRPCLYVSRKIGCLNGNNCAFCHLEHSKKGARPRPCKAKRNQCKQAVAMLQAVYQDDPEILAEAQQRMSKQSDYMQSIIRARGGFPAPTQKTSQSTKALNFVQSLGL
jgi:hypothetical protein